MRSVWSVSVAIVWMVCFNTELAEAHGNHFGSKREFHHFVVADSSQPLHTEIPDNENDVIEGSGEGSGEGAIDVVAPKIPKHRRQFVIDRQPIRVLLQPKILQPARRIKTSRSKLGLPTKKAPIVPTITTRPRLIAMIEEDEIDTTIAVLNTTTAAPLISTTTDELDNDICGGGRSCCGLSTEEVPDEAWMTPANRNPSSVLASKLIANAYPDGTRLSVDIARCFPLVVRHRWGCVEIAGGGRYDMRCQNGYFRNKFFPITFITSLGCGLCSANLE